MTASDPSIEIVERPKDQESFYSLWCIKATSLTKRLIIVEGENNVEESHGTFNVVAHDPGSAINGFLHHDRPLWSSGWVLMRLTIESVTWCAEVHSSPNVSQST